MPIDPDFANDCPYGPGGLLLDEILEICPAESRIVALMQTHDELPLTREQRCHPIRHPRHVSGGLLVHMSGMIGFAHAYFILALRHREGWIGYGGRIYDARFKELALPGIPLRLACRATRIRRSEQRIFARYELLFSQEDRVVYQGDQAAMWIRNEES